jgi:outer membrane protein assembly factor BamB
MKLVPRFQLSSAFLSIGLASIACLTITARADDWPQWRGPNRDGISKETGWLVKWPAEGPAKLWEASIGIGYSSFSVSKGRVYTMGNVAEKDNVYCLDAETGKLKWKYEYPCESRDPNGYHGTRCTPTVDGDYVYTLSRQGHFFCLDTATGQPVWAKDFKKDFGGKPPQWGFAGSPLIEKNWVLSEAGGPGASVVAFIKTTGELVWKNGSDGAGYGSLFAYDNGGERCFAQFPKDNLVGRRMKNGSEMWRLPWKTSYGVNATTPIIQGDEMFISTGYGYGCALLKVSPTGVQEIWRNKNMRNHVNSCVLVNGFLYGYDEGELKCLDWKTGEVKWATGKYGKGSLICVGGKLVLYGQTGKLGLAEPNPESFQEICSFQALPGKDTWANPVLANGRLYVRSLDKMVALDVKAK